MLPRRFASSFSYASLASCGLATAIALTAPEARAQEVAAAAAPPPPPSSPVPEEEEPPPGLRGPRLGITPGVGMGVVAFTGNVAFPSFVFTTALQFELLLELTRWGFFLRGGFLSSGDAGRWNAPTVALGTQYRLIGDGEERWGVVARGGILYERWSAVSAQQGCEVLYFIPNSCQDFVEPTTSGTVSGAAPPPAFTTTADSVGLLAALRVEVPVEPIYLAFDAELSASADVDQSAPGLAIGGRLLLTIALRDHAKASSKADTYRERHRFR